MVGLTIDAGSINYRLQVFMEDTARRRFYANAFHYPATGTFFVGTFFFSTMFRDSFQNRFR